MRQEKAQYKGLAARDARFDGVFFVGVTSTGIYCRPICPAKTPKEANCRFFDGASAAEQAGFRPCLRCRPELAPGAAPVDDAQRIAQLILQRLDEACMQETGVESIADQLQLSSRQLRRIITSQFGVPPVQLLLTRRLLLAKQLLTETTLPITEVAFASGFGSLRRFNDAFQRRYDMPPTRLRKKAAGDLSTVAADTLVLQLAYRPPYDWRGTLAFLNARALTRVEWVTEDFYMRTVALGGHKGWLRVTQAAGKNALKVELSHTLVPVLPAVLRRLRNLFDLDARPDIIAAHLGADKTLAPLVRKNPGLRVPGAFDGFEVGLRAILGQQITVKAATTIGGRLVAATGESIATPYPALNRLTPTPARIAGMPAADLAALGIIRTRGACMIALARAEISGDISLNGAYQQPEEFIAKLCALRGIGPWTAHYIAMRSLRWPDAFPPGDVALRNNLGNISAARADDIAEAWRPWRSYGLLHTWSIS